MPIPPHRAWHHFSHVTRMAHGHTATATVTILNARAGHDAGPIYRVFVRFGQLRLMHAILRMAAIAAVWALATAT